MDTQAISAGVGTTGTAAGTNAASALGGDAFFQLLIAQLVNQDPLEPTSNQDLLNQISSIREIELSTNLSESLKSLTAQQRFASAGSLIGQFVSGQSADGTAVRGTVSAVRFDATGKVMLELADGSQLPLEAIQTITSDRGAAEGLIGRFVTGVDRADPADLLVVEGVVTGVKTGEDGQITLELDTGGSLRLADVIDARAVEEA